MSNGSTPPAPAEGFFGLTPGPQQRLLVIQEKIATDLDRGTDIVNHAFCNVAKRLGGLVTLPPFKQCRTLIYRETYMGLEQGGLEFGFVTYDKLFGGTQYGLRVPIYGTTFEGLVHELEPYNLDDAEHVSRAGDSIVALCGAEDIRLDPCLTIVAGLAVGETIYL